ncbi:MAG: phosphatidylcholine/phosphatidylserine synthase [Pseudomonadota bacterium]
MRKPIKKIRTLKNISIAWLLPNLMTMAGFATGLTGLRFGLNERWDIAVLMVALAGVIDALDGRMARFLKSASSFGAHLDSLSDLVVFGIVPALSLYLWALQSSGRWAWAACLFYTICIALRLARFNSELQDDTDSTKNYFSGIPAPAAAMLVLVPIVADLQFQLSLLYNPVFLSLWLVVVGIGAISIIPTFTGKELRIPRTFALPMMGAFALVVVMLIVQPWLTWLVLAGIYAACLPLSCWLYYKHNYAASKSTKLDVSEE